MSRFWTCQRVKAGVKCGTRNPRVKQKCAVCGGKRPPASKPKHLAALAEGYDAYVAINGSDECGICCRKPSTTRRLDRDHDHATGMPRGLLCHRCNRTLAPWVTPEWLRRAAAYLERSQGPGVRAVTPLGPDTSREAA